MRITYSLVFLFLVVVLGICAFLAMRSHRPIAKKVSSMMFAFMVPIIGNIIIIASTDIDFSRIGYYTYFLGMDLLISSLFAFTFVYCDLKWKNQFLRYLPAGLILADVFQYALNPYFKQAFEVYESKLEDVAYFEFTPYIGQLYHRLVVYGFFVAIMIIFMIKTVRASSIKTERYSVILGSLFIAGIWELYYIITEHPIDKSMIGFAVLGLVVFYFAIVYKPTRVLDRFLASIASQMNESVFFFETDGKCIWANRPGMMITGITSGNYEHVNEKLDALFGDVEIIGDDWSRKHRPHQTNDVTSNRYFVLEKQAVYDDSKKILGYFLNIRDNTDEQLELEREKYNATHDSLTGLYNRDHLFEKFKEMIRDNPDTEYNVIFVDIADFKIINSIYGDEFGDFVLKNIADRIRRLPFDRYVYGRLIGDTFGICVPRDDFNPYRIEEELTSFTVCKDSVEHNVLIHLGVYEIDDYDIDIAEMFDRARMSLADIQDDYKTHIAYYDNAMRQMVLWNRRISSELNHALDTNEIRPYLQPIVDNSGNLIGAEALVRWVHPEEGFMSPGKFVPIFEKNGMIADVDKHMWRSVCKILSKWKNINRDIFISINISPKDFYFMDVPEEIKTMVEEFNVDPKQLRIEITETFVMTDVEKRIAILEDLRSSGFVVEMDDFGSGYSSLNMLKDIPVDVIKIDMAFLRKSETVRAQTILHNIIKLSEELGISSLTEGVETSDQFSMLSDMGCSLFQGYLFSKPMPVEEFEEKYHLQEAVND